MLPDVTWHRHANEIDRELWRLGFPAPLEGKWWYEALERANLGEQFEFYYARVHQNGRDIAVAPAFVMNVPIEPYVPDQWMGLYRQLAKLFPAILYQRTLFFGSPCAEEGSIGILPETERYTILCALQEAAQIFAKKLRVSNLVWKDFPEEYTAEFQKLCHSYGLFKIVSFPGTVVSLPLGEIDEYLAGLKSGHRHNLKKKWRRSEAVVSLEAGSITNPNAEQLDEIFALFWQTYLKATTKFERLNRRFFEELAQHPQCVFLTLRLKDQSKLAAFMLCFVEGDYIINKFIGIDYALPKEWYMYFRLWRTVVDYAMARQARAIQSGQTAYKIKLESGHQLVGLNNYCRLRNPMLHALFKKIAKDVRWETLDDDLKIYLKAIRNKP